MDVILVPGLWLAGSSWAEVQPVLERAGHRTHPLTLPGLESPGADRTGIGLADHVAAVVSAIDAADGPVVVVGHSAGSGIVWAAVDARPDRVAHAVLVGGFPSPDGGPIADGFDTEGADLPLPPWSEFEEADLTDLDDAGRERFRAQAVPSPAAVVSDRQQLSDERRYDVPVTMVCPEYTGEMVRGWLAQGAAPVSELGRIRAVRYVDLPTGHWPQFTRPRDLGRMILSVIEAAPDAVIDEFGRPEPPIGADELTTLVGFLDWQRATLAWKCDVAESSALNRTTAASSMTLGGLLKHVAYVEDDWFVCDLHDRPKPPPWDAVDWSADRDWEWHSAANDSPDELFGLWHHSIARARAALAEALANGGGLDQRAKRLWPDGQSPSLRWILAHMIEEYARHNGHADLLRETIDGATGE